MRAVPILLAFALAVTGGLLDLRRSKRDNRKSGGPAWTMRPASWAGFAAGLPFYLAAVVLLLLAP